LEVTAHALDVTIATVNNTRCMEVQVFGDQPR